MTGRRLAAVLAAAALLLTGAGVAVGQSAAPQAVSCSYSASVLTCPVPQVTVRATVRTTVRTTVTATPTTASSTSSTPPAAFPDASNTGVPAGTALTAYTGPMTITTTGAVIDSKLITGGLAIRATGVTVKNSKVVGSIDADNGGSVAILDTEIDNGHSSVAGVTQDNVTMRRVNVHGGRQSVTCGSNCDIQDSWLHGQTADDPSWHDNGYISNGGSNVLLRHNSIACEGANPVCTGPVALFGDFAPISNVTIDGNLILSTSQSGTLVGAYCLYGGADPGKAYPTPTSVRITNNVFQKGAGVGSNSSARCAYYGAVTSLGSAANGNTFTGNVYDDGTPVT